MAEDHVPWAERKHQGLCTLGQGTPRTMVLMERTQYCLWRGTVRAVFLSMRGAKGHIPGLCSPGVPMSRETLQAVSSVTWGP